MKDLWKVVFSVLCTLLGVGVILLISAPPRGQPIELEPPPSPFPVVFYITGEVEQPGLYKLAAGSRLQDAIQAAGGLTTGADQTALNLAAFIPDGAQITVPTRSISAPATAPTPTLFQTEPVLEQNTPTPLNPPTLRPTFPIDINTAEQAELELLPQIGPVRAARILGYRNNHGLFKTIEQIQNVYDITPEVFAAIRDLITVSVPTPAAATPGSQ